MAFKEISIEECTANFASDFKHRFSLVSAKDADKTNMLTVAWAQVGFLWKRPVATVYIRPSRYTKGFMDASGMFTVSFIDGHEKDVMYLGTHSGRDEDKLAATSLHLVDIDGQPTYEEADLVLVCKIIHAQQIDLSCSSDPTIEKECYPQGDVSIEYIGQIEKIFVKE